MLHGTCRICRLLAAFVTVLLIVMFNEISTVDASRRIINSFNLTSSNTEKVKVLNYEFDQTGTVNISFQALQPWDHIKVRLYYLKQIFFRFDNLINVSFAVQHADNIQRSHRKRKTKKTYEY